MSLVDKLISTPQREKGGSLAMERLDYQVAWGITHLFELHASGKDYAIGFEFHDDVIVIDSTSTPSKVKFYQVKTAGSSDNWTIEKLTKPQNNKDLTSSPAGKMLSNKLKFPNETESLGFVSNRPCNFLNSDKNVCCFSEATKENFDKFIENLKKGFPSTTEEEARLFHYHPTELPIESADALVKGKLVEFISNKCGPLEYNVDGFFISIADQCRKRSKNIKDVSSFQELIDSKFISREEVEKWLVDLIDRVRTRPNWADALQELGSISAPAKRKLAQAWKKYETSQFDPANTQLNKLRSFIREKIDAPELQGQEDIWTISSTILQWVRDELGVTLAGLNDDYIRAAILYEWYRYEE